MRTERNGKYKENKKSLMLSLSINVIVLSASEDKVANAVQNLGRAEFKYSKPSISVVNWLLKNATDSETTVAEVRILC
jgi:hypothetical protein